MATLVQNRQVPRRFFGLKRLLLPVKRWVLLNFYLDLSYYRQQPDRQWLEQQLRPRLENLQACRVLFVGCAFYTWEYLHAFHKSVDLTTVDIDGENEIWGGKKHLIADVLEIDSTVEHKSFDLVLLNGIFGHGVNTPDVQEKAFEALHKILKPGGLLLVGWNHDLIVDPLELAACHRLFYKSDFEGLPQRTSFSDSTHVFDLLRAKSTPS